MTGVVICSIARTPITKFCGSLSALKGSELGAVAIKGALSRLNQPDVKIREAILGNVVSAGMGQAPGEYCAVDTTLALTMTSLLLDRCFVEAF